EGIMSRLSASNRQLQISTAADWEANANGSRNKQVEGVVLGGDASPDMVADFLRRGVSVVFVNNDIGSFDVPSVVADERGGIEQIIDHLTKKGHKRIAMLAGAFSPYVSKARYGGFLEAMEKRGLPVTSDAVQLCAPDDIEGSVEPAMTLSKRTDRPTAIVGANDVIAAGAMKAAMRLGIRIPEELSVVGIDDSNLCPAMEPELTSVRIHCRRMGEESARVLEALLNKEESVPRNTVVPVELIIRRSC
ncbi:MAG: substrate-binding domain-containing protein, partial [Clostridia bacterium]|nr:substrate-binding domain-containing protein [Clostridia bacterium]